MAEKPDSNKNSFMRKPAVLGTAAAVVVAGALAWQYRASLQHLLKKPHANAPVETTDAGGTDGTDGDATNTDTTAPVARGPLPTLAELAPSFHLDGPDGAVPQAIRIAFARPISSTGSGSVGAGTVVEILPKTEGSLRLDGTQQLVFTPNTPFAFKKSYSAILKSLDIDGQSVEFGADKQASHTFETPEFSVLRVNMARFGGNAGEYDVAANFTGPVDAAQVGAKASFTAKGRALKARWRQGSTANEALATVNLPSDLGAHELAFTLKGGLVSAAQGAVIAKAYNGSIRLFEGPDIEVKMVRLKEGTNGFYIQVICNDRARAPGGDDEYRNRVYWYDNETHDGMYVSDRCQLDEQAAQTAIKFDPPLKGAYSVVPSRGGFRVIGDFATGDLAMTIESGTPSVDGAVLKVPVHEKFVVPHRKPQVTFAAQGRYLPRDAWKSLGVRHLNVKEAKVTVRVIPLENLVFWLSGDTETADDRTSHLVLEKTIALQGEADKMETTFLDLATVLPEPPRGVVELAINDSDGSGTVDKKRLVATSMNLVVKAGGPAGGERSIMVWVLGMHDAKPMSGVDIKVITRSGRSLGDCSTSGDGGCKVSIDMALETDKSPAFAMIATKGQDVTYLRFEDLKTEVSEQLVQGRPFSGGNSPYRAAIFSERGAYRPGETAHIGAVVRGDGEMAPKDGMPVELSLFDPREKLLRKVALTTNSAGLVTADLSFPSFANTGRHRVTLSAGGKEIGEYAFNVEEFVPERLKVEVKAKTVSLTGDQQAEVEVNARYLFGGSAEGSRVELNCEIWPSTFQPKENANFAYGVWYPDDRAPKAIPLGAVSGQLDSEGKAALGCPAATTPLFAGPAKVMARAAVFEGESGRSSQMETTIPLHPEQFYVGLSSGQDLVKRGETLTYQGVIVDWEGKLIAKDATVEIELVRLETEYDWSWDDDGGGSGYKIHLRQATEGKSEVVAKGGKFSGTFKVATGGAGFLVRAKLGNARTDLSLKGDQKDWWWWYPGESGRDQTPKPFKPTWLDVTGPDLVEAGSKATFKVTVPFKGRLLFTAETDGVVASEWRDVEAGPQEWTINAVEKENFRPNIYVGAFLVKDPHLESPQGFMPDRAFGVRSFRVNPARYAHTLKVQAPGEILPNSTLTVDLDLGDDVDGDAFVMVAAVDEGILQLTRFKTPNPLLTLFEARALGVDTFETVGWNVLLPGSGPASNTGGDGGEGEKPISLVKPVALWSGVKAVPKGGKLSVSLEVPQYRGELRVMAVSVDRSRVGSASVAVPVRDPLVLQTTLPRFLTEGDEFQIPVSVTNMSGAEQKVTVELDVKSIDMGGDAGDLGEVVKIVGNRTSTIPLAVGKTETVVFRGVAASPVGGAAFAVKASTGGKKPLISHEDLEVPILSARPRTRTLTRVELGDGETDILPKLAGFVPTTERTSVWVTANPYADAMGHLKYLIQYPYGCIEQTTSTTRPLLVIRDLLQEADPGLLSGGSTVDDMIKKGIERVLSMQTNQGGFGYWPGDDSPTLWGTAYASHMLIDAQKLGYAVPKERLDDALEYLRGQILNRYRYAAESDDEGYYDIRHAAGYMHYVLALAGKGLKADMDQMVERLAREKQLDSEEAEELYLVKAGLYLAGDRRFEKDLRRPDVSPITAERRNSWSYWSDLRRRGMMLNVFADLFGADADGERLAAIVAEGVRGHASYWYTTQELVWAITGLGKYVAGGAKDFEAKLMVDGKARKPAVEGAKSWSVNRASEKKTLVVDVNRKGKGKVYAVLASDGVRANEGVKTGGEGLRIARAYRTPEGQALDVESDVTLGRVIFVELTIDNLSSERIENVALVDRFPAAWEVENPRLGRGTTADFMDAESIWPVSYMNIRDDRLEVFGSLKPGETKKVWYALRATVAGRFAIPPVEAEAMYDPRIWARAVGGHTIVKGPWEEFAGP